MTGGWWWRCLGVGGLTHPCQCDLGWLREGSGTEYQCCLLDGGDKRDGPHFTCSQPCWTECDGAGYSRLGEGVPQCSETKPRANILAY